MRAVVYQGSRKLSLEERPVPEPGPREVVVEVSHCGICGTDLHLVLEEMGRPGSVGGHEWSGRIVSLGSDVGGWREGELVVGGPSPSCGACHACLAGRPSLCSGRGEAGMGQSEGAFADYVRVGADALVRVPDGLGAREAALAEPLAVALHAITRSAVEPGARALVTGAGPLGLLLIAALRARGVEAITASEPAPRRRERAGGVGATLLLEPEALVSPPMPFSIVDEPYDVAFECSGNPRAMESALAQLRRTGTLVIVGTGMRRPKLDHNRVLLNELVVTGAYCYDAGGFDDALSLLASGKLPTDALIEPGDVPLSGLEAALHGLAAGELAGKVMVVPKEVP